MQEESEMLSSDYFVNDEERSVDEYISRFFNEDKPEFSEVLPQQQLKKQDNNDDPTDPIDMFSQPVNLRQIPNTHQQVKRKRKNSKPSPFHNYQKHLITFLRQVIFIPFEMDATDSYKSAARQLWAIFVSSSNATKKILHYIFNEENQHKPTPEQLREFGFLDLYLRESPQTLKQAKNYLTYIVLLQTTNATTDEYLKKRRIRNTLKFKKYIQHFRNELNDGFLKKRFTNPPKDERKVKIGV